MAIVGHEPGAGNADLDIAQKLGLMYDHWP